MDKYNNKEVSTIDCLKYTYRIFIEFMDSIKDMDLEEVVDYGFSEQKKDLIIKLLEYSWYLPNAINTNEYFDLIVMLDSEIIKDKLDTFMVEVIANNKENIEVKVLEYFDSRKMIATEAFKCNELGLYYSCVATMFTLIDGISNDLFKIDFFRKKKNGDIITKSKVEEIKSQNEFTLMELVEFYPLEVVTNLVVKADERVNYECKDMFNRHAVIHGIDTDFGTYINVCRCYAILSFLVGIYEIKNGVKN